MTNASLKSIAIALSASVVSIAALPALAGQVAAASYDMHNGDGQASGGSYNYWDLNYTGSGSTTTDGAALAGGLGDLTDGVVAPNFWYIVENGAGTGPYVGWYAPVTLNPTVTFHFSGSPTITDIKIHMDNSGVGGVFAPSAILIDGVNTPFTAPASGSIGFVDFSGLNLTGGSHTIQFDQKGGTWTFVSEIDFFGGVPEPASWALMLFGSGVIGAALRRRGRAYARI